MIIVLAAIVLGKWELKRLVMFLAIVALCFGACNAFHKVSQSMAPPEYTVHDVPVDVPLSEL